MAEEEFYKEEVQEEDMQEEMIEEDDEEVKEEETIYMKIKNLLDSDALVFGTETTLKHLKKGLLSDIVVSSTTPNEVRATIDHYAKLTPVTVHYVKENNEQLGVLCKKPFALSVLGIKKQA